MCVQLYYFIYKFKLIYKLISELWLSNLKVTEIYTIFSGLKPVLQITRGHPRVFITKRNKSQQLRLPAPPYIPHPHSFISTTYIVTLNCYNCRSDHRSVQCIRPLYKTEVLAVIIVVRLHSPATSNDQHSSHQTCSVAPAVAQVNMYHNSVRQRKV